MSKRAPGFWTTSYADKRKAKMQAAEIAAALATHPAPAPAAAAPDVPAMLAQLGALRDQGVVTPAEFEAKKAELLARM